MDTGLFVGKRLLVDEHLVAVGQRQRASRRRMIVFDVAGVKD